MKLFTKALFASAACIAIVTSAGAQQAPEGFVLEPETAEIDFSKVTEIEIVQDFTGKIEAERETIKTSQRLYESCQIEAERQGGETGAKSQLVSCEIDASNRLMDHFRSVKAIVTDGGTTFRLKAEAVQAELSVLSDTLRDLQQERVNLDETIREAATNYREVFETLDPEKMTREQRREMHDKLTELTLVEIKMQEMDNDAYALQRQIQAKTGIVGDMFAWSDQMYMASNDVDVAIAQEDLIVRKLRNDAVVGSLTSTTNGVPAALSRIGTVFNELRNYKPREVIVETPPLSETEWVPTVPSRGGDYEAMRNILDRFAGSNGEES